MERFQINRLVRWVNGAIAICLLLFLVAAYRYAWRPLPQTSGTIRAFLHECVEVRRDTLGVPRIERGGRSFCAGLRDRAGPPIPDGQPAPPGRRHPLRSGRAGGPLPG